MIFLRNVIDGMSDVKEEERKGGREGEREREREEERVQRGMEGERRASAGDGGRVGARAKERY
jgi:hypothetical protein